MTALPIRVDARIDRICEYTMDGDIAGIDPTDAAAIAGLQWKGQILAAKPQPYTTCRSELGEAREDCADGRADSFIGMKSYLTVILSPNKSHGKSASKFAARGLVANAAEKSCPQHMRFCLAHGALEAEYQTIVEQCRMIDAVAVTDEGICETAKIEQTIPVGIVAREARNLEAKNDADVTESNFGGKSGEATPINDAGSSNPEIFIDDDDLLR